MYYAMRASAPSLNRESTDSLIHTTNSEQFLITVTVRYNSNRETIRKSVLYIWTQILLFYTYSLVLW